MDSSEKVEDIVVDIVDDALAHHGVKGQKWGVRRKATVGPQEVIVRDSRVPFSKRQVAKGGRGHPAVAEATRSREIGRIGQKSGTKALTNRQLEEYNRRLNLEQNFHRLSYADKNPGQKFVATIMRQTGKNAMNSAANEGAKKVGRGALNKATRSSAKAAFVAARVAAV